jgi:predicted RNA-binding Zn-ribbon protein involved in translation (DUF1610 family)
MKVFTEKLERLLAADTINTVCPAMECRGVVKVARNADRVTCPHCGTEFSRSKSGLLLGKRGQR